MSAPANHSDNAPMAPLQQRASNPAASTARTRQGSAASYVVNTTQTSSSSSSTSSRSSNSSNSTSSASVNNAGAKQSSLSSSSKNFFRRLSRFSISSSGSMNDISSRNSSSSNILSQPVAMSPTSSTFGASAGPSLQIPQLSRQKSVPLLQRFRSNSVTTGTATAKSPGTLTPSSSRSQNSHSSRPAAQPLQEETPSTTTPDLVAPKNLNEKPGPPASPTAACDRGSTVASHLVDLAGHSDKSPDAALQGAPGPGEDDVEDHDGAAPTTRAVARETENDDSAHVSGCDIAAAECNCSADCNRASFNNAGANNNNNHRSSLEKISSFSSENALASASDSTTTSTAKTPEPACAAATVNSVSAPTALAESPATFSRADSNTFLPLLQDKPAVPAPANSSSLPPPLLKPSTNPFRNRQTAAVVASPSSTATSPSCSSACASPSSSSSSASASDNMKDEHTSPPNAADEDSIMTDDAPAHTVASVAAAANSVPRHLADSSEAAAADLNFASAFISNNATTPKSPLPSVIPANSNNSNYSASQTQSSSPTPPPPAAITTATSSDVESSPDLLDSPPPANPGLAMPANTGDAVAAAAVAAAAANAAATNAAVMAAVTAAAAATAAGTTSASAPPPADFREDGRASAGTTSSDHTDNTSADPNASTSAATATTTTAITNNNNDSAPATAATTTQPQQQTSSSVPNADPSSTSAGVNETAGNTADPQEEYPYSIRLTPYIDHSSPGPMGYIATVERTAKNGMTFRVGRLTDKNDTSQTRPEHSPVVFRSKVVSRSHAQLTVMDGQWFVQDVKSSSGTFLNHVRLSQQYQQSQPFPLRDGDVLQLGMDFRGGTEELYKCIKVRVEVNRSWQRRANNFNVSALSNLRALQAVSPADVQECAICLFPVAPCQALFVSPCTHSWHYKCIRPLIIKTYPHFLCPNCRAMCDLEAEIESPDLSHLQVEDDAG